MKQLLTLILMPFMALFSSRVWAETAQVGEKVAQPSEYFGQIMVSLLLVLLIIFISAWLLRRYGRFPGVAQGNLKVLGALSVGQRERIMLIQVGKEQIVVGITTSRISKLHQLEEPIEVKDNEANVTLGSPFAKRLQEALTQRKDSQNQREDS